MKMVLLTTHELLSKSNPDKYGLLDLFIILVIKKHLLNYNAHYNLHILY